MKTFIVSALFIVSGLLGFCCQMLYAYYFGSGKEMDIYFSLLSIPAIITGATGTVFSSLFFPIFARIERPGLDAYIFIIKIYVSRIALIIALAGFAITYFNLSQIIETKDPFYYNMALILSILFWLNGYISIVNGYLASVQNYFKNFLIVSFSSLLIYVSIIAFVTLFHDLMGVSSIAVGMVFATIMTLLINRYYGGIFRKSNIKVNLDVKGIFNKIFLILISFLPFHAFASIAYMWAGQLDYEGSVSFLGYSHSFCGFLSTAASMGIATVSFPDLARSLSSKDTQELDKGYKIFRNQLEVVVIFASFVAVFVSFFAYPIIEILFMRGQFDINAVSGLALVLPIYLINGVFIAMMNLTRNVYYSLNKQKLFAIISGAVTLIFVFTSILLSYKVNYIVVGIVETLAMGLFMLISLYFINTFSRVFDCKFVLKTIEQLLILIVIGWLAFFIYEEMIVLRINNYMSIFFAGIIYTLLADIILGTLFKSPIVIEINKKMLFLFK